MCERGIHSQTGDLCVRVGIHSQTGNLTKEDNRVQGSGKVHNWKTCKKPMEDVAQKQFECKQKRDKRRWTVAGIYKLGCVC